MLGSGLRYGSWKWEITTKRSQTCLGEEQQERPTFDVTFQILSIVSGVKRVRRVTNGNKEAETILFVFRLLSLLYTFKLRLVGLVLRARVCA